MPLNNLKVVVLVGTIINKIDRVPYKILPPKTTRKCPRHNCDAHLSEMRVPPHKMLLSCIICTWWGNSPRSAGLALWSLLEDFLLDLVPSTGEDAARTAAAMQVDQSRTMLADRQFLFEWGKKLTNV